MGSESEAVSKLGQALKLCIVSKYIMLIKVLHAAAGHLNGPLVSTCFMELLLKGFPPLLLFLFSWLKCKWHLVIKVCT